MLDYRDVDPRFGTLADADALIGTAHELGLRVIVDIVPNHSSSEHAWFQEALAAAPGSAARARYLFRDGKGEGGAEPPNNWQSTFGGSAWERVEPTASGTCTSSTSPSPTSTGPTPRSSEEMERTLRFWMDRGADGFRIDVAHGLVKKPGLPDAPPFRHELSGTHLRHADVGPARACTTSTATGGGSPTATPCRARTPTASCAPRRG